MAKIDMQQVQIYSHHSVPSVGKLCERGGHRAPKWQRLAKASLRVSLEAGSAAVCSVTRPASFGGARHKTSQVKLLCPIQASMHLKLDASSVHELSRLVGEQETSVKSDLRKIK